MVSCFDLVGDARLADCRCVGSEILDALPELPITEHLTECLVEALPVEFCRPAASPRPPGPQNWTSLQASRWRLPGDLGK